MARRLTLPLTERLVSSLGTPTVDAIRKRLGGRSSTEPTAGRLVRIVATDRVGVVLHEREGILDVYTEKGFVRRTPIGEVAPAHAPAGDLGGVATDARVFATLAEGQRVRYQTSESAMAEGKLVEKCRYGGLVERDDGAIVGVGFRRLWPAIDSRERSS